MKPASSVLFTADVDGFGVMSTIVSPLNRRIPDTFGWGMAFVAPHARSADIRGWHEEETRQIEMHLGDSVE